MYWTFFLLILISRIAKLRRRYYSISVWVSFAISPDLLLPLIVTLTIFIVIPFNFVVWKFCFYFNHKIPRSILFIGVDFNGFLSFIFYVLLTFQTAFAWLCWKWPADVLQIEIVYRKSKIPIFMLCMLWKLVKWKRTEPKRKKTCNDRDRRGGKIRRIPSHIQPLYESEYEYKYKFNSWIYWSKNILFNRCSMFVYRQHQKPYALVS